MPTPVLSIDLETCSPALLPKVGAFKYAEHEDTQIVCMAYGFTGEAVRCWVAQSGEPLPQRVVAHVRAGGPVAAFNAGFEMAILSGHCGETIGFPKTRVSQWRDTAAKVAAHGLPRSLSNAAMALKGIPQKDEAGRKVMLRLSKPAGLAKATSEQLEQLYSYCVNDVTVERAIDGALPALLPFEQKMWELDYRTNKRGILIDLPLAQRIEALLAEYLDRKIVRCVELTGARPSQRAVIMEWCAAQGYPLTGYTAADIAEALADDKAPASVREVLSLRKVTALAAVKKYTSLTMCAGRDSRIRGMFLYHGAMTGRWTGRLAQLHNLARPVLLRDDKGINSAIERIQQGWLPVEDDGSVLPAFKDLIRSMILAPEGFELEVSDFSSIEARVIGWMAGDVIYQRAFTEGLDLYKVTAANIYGVSYDCVTDDQRFLGKQAVLGLSYAMGVQKFIDTVAKTGRVVPDELITRAHTTYRETYHAIVQLWSDFGAAAIKATQTGTVQRVGQCVLGCKVLNKDTPQEITFLYTQLPSGRRLAYYQPRAEMVATPWGAQRLAFTAQVLNEQTKQLERKPAHGGLLAQHATQAIARDLLASSLNNARALPVVAHVHDEIVLEKPLGAAPQLPTLMTALPPWAKGMIVEAHGFCSKRYRK